MQKKYHLSCTDTIPKECETLLFEGLNNDAVRSKGMEPTRTFAICVKDDTQHIFGAATGVTMYGSLYVDMLWIESTIRHQGWGTKLIHEAEKIGRERGCTFATLNTMDWEALPFYQKLGYTIEFTREGYENDSKMFMLKKAL